MESLTLQQGGSIIGSGDAVGQIQFAAPSESDAGASRYIVGQIYAQAEGAFNSVSNPASLVFSTSAADNLPASGKLKVSHEGHFLPLQDNTYDLGAPDLRFRHLYAADAVISPTGELSYLYFDTTVGDVDQVAGQLNWNSEAGTIDLGLTDDLTIHLGQSVLFRVKNSTGSTITKGQAVYASGVLGGGQVIQVAPFAADESVDEVRFIGLMTDDLANGEDGFVNHFGHIKNVDLRTSNTVLNPNGETWNIGDILFVDDTSPGGLTKVQPKDDIYVALVLADGQNGELFVRITDPGHINDLHDVDTSGLVDNNFLVWNSGNEVWEPSSGLYYVDDKLGVGVESPTRTLDVQGSMSIHSTSIPTMEIGFPGAGGQAYVGYTASNQTLNFSAFDGSHWDNIRYKAGSSFAGNHYFYTSSTTSPDVAILKSGRVGISTIGPDQRLHVNDGNIKIENSINPTIEFDDASYVRSKAYYDTSSETFILQHTDADANQLVLTSGNDVGIGTNAPNATLHAYSPVPSSTVFNVEGTNGSLFSVVDNLSGVLMSVNNNAGLPVFEVYDDDSIIAGRFAQNDFVIGSGGNVGIGTDSAVTKLDVSGVITATGGNSNEWNQSYDWVAASGGLPYVTGVGTANQVAFWNDTNGLSKSYYLHWDTVNNRLGIGTGANIDEDLHIESYTRNTSIKIESHSPYVSPSIKLTNGSNTWQQYLFSSNFYLKPVGGEGDLYFIDSSGTTSLQIDNSNNSVFIPNGNVGIGTTSPSAKLDVNGSVNVANDVIVGGNVTINGTTVTANAESMQVKDPIITLGLASGNVITNDTYDRGLALVTNNGTAFMGWDNSADKFVMLSSGVATNSSGNYDAGTYGNLHIAGLTASTANFSSTIDAANLGAGEDNSVVILDSDGKLRTDEIDSRVWGTSLVDGGGVAGHVAFWTDNNTLSYDSNQLVWDSTNNRLGIGTSNPTADIQIGNIEANAPSRKLIITGYSSSSLDFNNHNGWSLHRFVSDINGGMYYYNDGTNNTTTKFNIGKVTRTNGELRIFNSSSSNIQMGQNDSYPVGYIGTKNEDYNYRGGLVFTTRESTTITNQVYIDRYGHLGIGNGTNSPSTELDVSGVITANGGNSDQWNEAYDFIQASGLDGTGAASGVAFWTDSNTLSYDSGLIWDSTNDRLGIGTTSPSEKLHVAASNVGAGTFAEIRNTSTSASSYAGIKLTTNYNGTLSTSQILDNWTGAGVIFQASRDLSTSQGGFNWLSSAGSTMMVLRRASSNNWLGLNTTNPTQTMDVRYPAGGGMALLKSTDTADGLLFGDMAYSTSNDYQGMKHAAMSGVNDYMMISNGTNTFISAAAGYNTIIGAGGNSDNGQIKVTPTEVSVNDNGSSNDFRVESNNNANMLFVDGIADRVGIGTGSPSYPLHVIGQINAGGASGHYSMGGWKALSYENSDELIIGENASWTKIGLRTGGSEALLVDSNGNVGIGITAPSGTLHIVGEAHVDNLKLDGNTLSATNTDGNLILNPNGNGALQIDSGGNARGAYAVDLQRLRGSTSQVASGACSFIGGGRNNTTTFSFSVIAGGYNNSSTCYGAVVAGGCSNTSSGFYSFVGGGKEVVASGNYSSVAGGFGNQVHSAATYGTMSGGYRNCVYGGLSAINGGLFNKTCAGYSIIGAGGYNEIQASGEYGFIGGGQSNLICGDNSCYGVIGGGFDNLVTNSYATVSGGVSNCASGSASAVGGGLSNCAGNIYGTVAGGRSNCAIGGAGYSAVGGGYSNHAGNTYSVIGGGYNNTSTGHASTVSGGYNNCTNRPYGFIGGGNANFAETYSVVAGGNSNCAVNSSSAVLGGSSNCACATLSSIVGGYLNSIVPSGTYGFIGGGCCNLICGNNSCYAIVTGGQNNLLDSSYAAIVAGSGNVIQGAYSGITSFSFIGGGKGNSVSNLYSVIAGGLNNTTYGSRTAVVGGASNNACGSYSIVGGGIYNLAGQGYSFVGGGYFNKICVNGSSGDSTIVAGRSNRIEASAGSGGFIGAGYSNTVASGDYASVVNGAFNVASGDYSAVVAGSGNIACGDWSFIGGGFDNCATNNLSTVSGGYSNAATGASTTVSGGSRNTSSGYAATIAGGRLNCSSQCYTTVGGGWNNDASQHSATIAGGWDNTASATCSTVSGGDRNRATNTFSTVGGGVLNEATGNSSIIAGGRNNHACGTCSTVSGGYANKACGNHSTVSGGYGNTASGACSTVGGGYSSIASGANSTVSGGCCNITNARHSVINGGHRNIIQSPTNECCSRGVTIGGGIGHNTSGGTLNAANGDLTGAITCCNAGAYSTISGGLRNYGTGEYSTISGGYCNTSSGKYSTVSGGYCNCACGSDSVVTGGSFNSVSGCYSVVNGGGYNISTGNCSSITGFGNDDCGFANVHIIGSNLCATQADTTYTQNIISAGDVSITGHLSASTKSFFIDHPSQKGKKLQYGSLESPYHGIRLTGKGEIKGGKCVVELPDYISSLVRDDENVNIQLTNYRHSKVLYVEDININDNQFTVKYDGWFGGNGLEFFWSFTAVRKDVQELKVEC